MDSPARLIGCYDLWVRPRFFQTRAKFLKANQQRFTDWGEADNHRIAGASLDEFHDLFVLISSYYQRLRWISKRKPIWYRWDQLMADAGDRFIGRTPYGKMFSPLSGLRKTSRQRLG